MIGRQVVGHFSYTKNMTVDQKLGHIISNLIHIRTIEEKFIVEWSTGALPIEPEACGSVVRSESKCDLL